MKNVTVDDIVTYLNSLAIPTVGHWHLLIRRSGSGYIGQGPSAAREDSHCEWSSVEDLKLRIACGARKDARTEVIRAAQGAVSNLAACVGGLHVERLRVALDALESFGADHD